MDLSTLAVPHTLTHLRQILPSPPARVIEAGCGRGALAAALTDLDYEVTGVDHDPEMAAAARQRGVSVIEADFFEVLGEYDVVLFTRSLHHATNLDKILEHAATLLASAGQIVVEEFAWERVDRAAADFLYDNRATLVDGGLLQAEQPSGDRLDAWIAGHQSLHRGSAMLDALHRVGGDLRTVDTSMLWRLVDGRGAIWSQPATCAPHFLNGLRDAEQDHIAAGVLPSVGLIVAVRP